MKGISLPLLLLLTLLYSLAVTCCSLFPISVINNYTGKKFWGNISELSSNQLNSKHQVQTGILLSTYTDYQEDIIINIFKLFGNEHI